MRKRSKRSRGVIDRSATTDVVTQLECAVRNPQAALIGALIGGLVPWFGRTLAHDQIPAAWSTGNSSLALVLITVVLGCALFSEGVMLVTTGATSTVALAVLILINAVANGSVIALSRDATRRRCEADARRAATRARGRAARPAQADAPAPHRAPVMPSHAPVAAPRAPRTSSTALVTPTWRRAALDDDVIDAEIVSEERLPS